MKTLLVLLAVLSFDGSARQSWPTVRPISKNYHFEDAKKATLTLPIENKAGKSLYVIRCEGPDATDTDSGASPNDFVFSGDFECRLYPNGKSAQHPTLFTELKKMERDWQSRARFLAAELIGACGEIPNFGRKRTFEVRGMRITLEVQNPVVSSKAKEGLTSFDFSVSVANDRAATREISSPPPPPVQDKKGCELNNSAQYEK